MSTLERAIEIAATAHAGAVDKAGGPYILHPLRVMLRVHGQDERIAAVLHDVVEKSPWTLERLREEGFSAVVVRALDALSRREGEPYEDYLERAAGDPLARVVKIADLEDNREAAKATDPEEKDRERFARYRRSLARLRA